MIGEYPCCDEGMCPQHMQQQREDKRWLDMRFPESFGGVKLG
jgi:hypothetical protein